MPIEEGCPDETTFHCLYIYSSFSASTQGMHAPPWDNSRLVGLSRSHRVDGLRIPTERVAGSAVLSATV